MLILVLKIGWLTYTITAAGIMGSFVDSFFGQFIQAKYQCNISGEIVEEKNNLNEKTILLNGVEWIDNNFVNLANTLTGALVAGLFFFLYG